MCEEDVMVNAKRLGGGEMKVDSARARAEAYSFVMQDRGQSG